MKQFKIPASIILAQAALESSWGTSKLATKGHNHFGIKCHEWSGERLYHNDDQKGECFRKYRSAEDSFQDHSLFLSGRERYSSLFQLGTTDYRGWAEALQKAGYATNPNYSSLLIGIIERYSLSRYDSPETLYNRDESPKSVQTITLKREVYTNNGVHYIIATPYDTFSSLAEEFSLFSNELYRFNNLAKGAQIEDKMIIYLERKKRRAAKGIKSHRVEKESTIWEVSQLYAIRLNSLKRLNSIKSEAPLIEGEILKLSR